MIEQRFADASRFTFVALTDPELVEQGSKKECVPVGALRNWLDANAEAAKSSTSSAFSVVLTDRGRVEEFRRPFG